MLRWWDGVRWSDALRSAAPPTADRPTPTPPPGGYGAYLTDAQLDAAGDGEPPRRPPSAAADGPEDDGGRGGGLPVSVSRGRATFAGLIVAVIMVCAIGVSALNAGAGVAPTPGGGLPGGSGGASGGVGPTSQPSTGPDLPAALSDRTVGVKVIFPDGWTPTGLCPQRYPELSGLQNGCETVQVAGAAGVVGIGNTSLSSLTADAPAQVAKPLNQHAANDQPGQVTAANSWRADIQGRAAYAATWHVTSQAPGAAPMFTATIVVDTGQRDAHNAELYSYVFVALAESATRPPVNVVQQLFDERHTQISVTFPGTS